MQLLTRYQGARGLWVLALLLGTAACGYPSAAIRAADLELKQDRSLESRARELFSRQRGRINGARVIESTPERLVLRVSYSGLASDGLYLSARALDRQREPL